MRKLAVLLIALLAGLCSYSFAEEQSDQQADMQKNEMRQEDARGERREWSGQDRKKEMMMKGGMMGGMGMHPSVTATSDGGVVILMGNKLAKYNSNLELVKEVELKGGPKPMEKRMDGMEQMRKPAEEEKVENAAQAPASESLEASAPTVNDPEKQ